MKTVRNSLLGLALIAPLAMAQDCVSPMAPDLPNGANASMEQMLAGQKAVKAFQAANLEYMSCLEGDLNAAEAAVKAATEEEKTAAQTAYDKAVEAYNAAVSREEEIAGQFNTEIREYKAANPQ
jgi:hypothetical protein